MSVDEEGWPTVHLETEGKSIDKVRFKRRPCGNDHLQADKFKLDQPHKRDLAVMASFTGVDSKILGSLEKGDMDNIALLFGLF